MCSALIGFHVFTGCDSVSSFMERPVCTDVNQARLHLFKLDVRSETGMPPNQDALQKHILRANYQAAIHKACMEQYPEIPPPVNHGWKLVDNNLVIDWMDRPPAPDSILEFVQCGCKKSKCQQRNCSCVQNGLPCTDLCHCSNCENKFVSDEMEDEVDTDEEVI
ncbi:hypothetical protein HOLleu_03446 [Holothuria leucospilota]|uniref:CRC domain-containing protein n=1 Tax=Holothuria leucospilota TaxID=206669 RepID=A0A9Q1CT14_HOLLE|nr:hypothetical protein HOLleu_03446 [Holothuria leucospilota]